MEVHLSTPEKKLDIIPFNEFEPIHDYIVGGGSFGIVKRKYWIKRKILVAMKQLYDATNFSKEESQLALVKGLIDEDKKRGEDLKYLYHIITIYGKTIRYLNGPPQSQILESYFVLEFAEYKCLHTLLHKTLDIKYKLEHALSWCLQCAYGVYYLHKNKLVHRDLKPLNLLLFNKGKTLKICDFGTVREINTNNMTNNRGSAAWMAPEVFISDKYSNKCDVFSWAIIFWEVLHREEPFQTFRDVCALSWAISKHVERPPLADDYPSIIKDLLTKAWSDDPMERPSMKEVIDWLEQLISLLGYENFQQMNDTIETLDMQLDTFETYTTNADMNSDAYHSNAFDNNFNRSGTKSKLGHKRSCSSDASKLLDSNMENSMTRTYSDAHLVTQDKDEEETFDKLMEKFNAYLMLDAIYQPVQPDVTNSKSVIIFTEHRKLSVKLFRQLYETPILENHINYLEQLKRDRVSTNIIEQDKSTKDIFEYPKKLYNENLDLKNTRSNIIQDLSKNLIDSNSFLRQTPTTGYNMAPVNQKMDEGR